MDDNYRPYWKRHPIQMRATAILMLIAAPILVPLVLLAAHWETIWREVAGTVKEIWNVVRTTMPPLEPK